MQHGNNGILEADGKGTRENYWSERATARGVFVAFPCPLGGALEQARSWIWNQKKEEWKSESESDGWCMIAWLGRGEASWGQSKATIWPRRVGWGIWISNCHRPDYHNAREVRGRPNRNLTVRNVLQRDTCIIMFDSLILEIFEGVNKILPPKVGFCLVV